MTRPAGVGRALKNNEKHPQQRDEWNEGKRIGRKKQAWVWDDPKGPFKVGEVTDGGGDLGRGTGHRVGHWEKVVV